MATTTNALTYLGQYTVYTFVSLLLLGAGLQESALGPALLVLGALGLVGTAFAAARLDHRPGRTTIVTLVMMYFVQKAVAERTGKRVV